MKNILFIFLFAFGLNSFAQGLSPRDQKSETSIEAKFSSTEEKLTVTFTFENRTKKPMYLTNDESPNIKSARFEPTETCVLISKLQKPEAGSPEVQVNTTRISAGKKYSGSMSWSIPLHHLGATPQGWSKTDKPKCQTIRFEIAAIPGYEDLKPEETLVNGKKLYRLSVEARRHQETQTAEAEGFEIPISLE